MGAPDQDSDDDCDIHIQVGADPKKHFPQGHRGDSAGEQDAAPAVRAGAWGKRDKATKVFDGARAAKVTVTGFAFFDASHVCDGHPKEEGAHRMGVSTLWEVHPLLAIKRAP